MTAFLYGLICLIWGSTWLAIKVGSEGVPPFLGAGLRFAMAGTLVGLIALGRKRPASLTRDDRICILSLGLLVFWLDYAAVYWAETRISSGLTAILFATMPLMTALLSAFWTKTEVLTLRKISGIVIGVIGTAFLFWPEERLNASQVLGMAAALFGAFCAAVNLVTMKRYGAKSDPFVLNTLGMGLGAVCLLATSAATERWSAAAWDQRNVIALVYLAVFGSVVAFTAYYRLIKELDATVVSYSTLVIPIVALVLGRVFLGESVTALAGVGIATILAGVGVALSR